PVSQRVFENRVNGTPVSLRPLGRVSESSMSVSRPTRRAVSLLCVSIALGACSSDLSAQTAGQPVHSTAAASSEPLVKNLPDFSPLVDKYGPAVVNVEVVEKAQQGGPGGLSPNDPFFDFFRRFGIPGPEGGNPHGG